jgi:hypothetical protein
MMNDHATVDIALDLWKDWMSSDWSELRPLWFPGETPGMCGNWSRGESAWEDLQESVESRIVMVVNTAVGNMSPAMRAALEMSLGLLSVCRIRNQEELATEARERVFRALMSNGCA